MGADPSDMFATIQQLYTTNSLTSPTSTVRTPATTTWAPSGTRATATSTTGMALAASTSVTTSRHELLDQREREMRDGTLLEGQGVPDSTNLKSNHKERILFR